MASLCQGAVSARLCCPSSRPSNPKPTSWLTPRATQNSWRHFGGRSCQTLQAQGLSTPQPAAQDRCGGGGGGGSGGNGGGGGGGGGEGHWFGGDRRFFNFATLVFTVLACSEAPAGAKVAKTGSGEVDGFVDKYMGIIWPMLQNLGFSGIVGYAAGFALRALGRTIALTLGVIFVIVQVMAYQGYISVNWTGVHKSAVRAFDVNHDGKFDSRDAKALAKGVLGVISQGVPSVGGFLVGFALGARG